MVTRLCLTRQEEGGGGERWTGGRQARLYINRFRAHGGAQREEAGGLGRVGSTAHARGVESVVFIPARITKMVPRKHQNTINNNGSPRACQMGTEASSRLSLTRGLYNCFVLQPPAPRRQGSDGW